MTDLSTRSIDHEPLLVATELYKDYSEEGKQIEVLRGIDLTIGEGEAVSIVGASGVGKSTLLQIIGTLEQPSRGRILFCGIDLYHAMDDDRRAEFRNRDIGFVFQFHHLLMDFNALENVMLPAMIAGFNPRQAREKAGDMLARVHLVDRLTHRPGELSGGERQRVAIARALVMHPKLIIADEPTGNLDQEMSVDIHRLLFQLKSTLQISLLIATHDIDLAQTAERRFRLKSGRLFDEGA